MKLIKQLTINGKIIEFVFLDLKMPTEFNAYYNLFVTCFGERSNINQETFKWFNFKSPLYENMSFAFIDPEKSRMIAAYGLLPGDVTVDGRIMKYAIATNAMTHPEYTGQGLFKQIGIESLNYAKNIGISFAFGIPNDKALPGHMKVGWEIPNELKFYEFNNISTSSPLFSKRVILNGIYTTSDSEYLNLFIKKYKFFFNRTMKWMTWRLGKPLNNYINFTISEPDEFAYIVLKEYYDQKNKIKKLHIVDFGYQRIETLNELIVHSQAVAKDKGFDIINLWQYPFNTKEILALKCLGFIETASANPVIIHKLQNDIKLPVEDWHVTLFDNDVY
jgi:hypothetical protein